MDDPRALVLVCVTSVTQLLEEALEQVRSLPSEAQDAVASIILEELADTRLRDEKFARTQDQLARLAEKVRADIRAGRTRDIEVDEL